MFIIVLCFDFVIYSTSMLEEGLVLTIMTANGGSTNIIPSLLKSAYYACSKIQRDRYDKLEVPDVDLQICCESIFQIMKLNTDSGSFESLGDKRSMFSKVPAVTHDKLIKNICEKAAFHGHIDCLIFAREIGIPWYDWLQ